MPRKEHDPEPIPEHRGRAGLHFARLPKGPLRDPGYLVVERWYSPTEGEARVPYDDEDMKGHSE